MTWPRPLVVLLDWLNRKGKSAAIRLVRLTGKSPHRIHPKHLIAAPWHDWYLTYLKPTDRVLDLGCGQGAHTLVAAQRVQFIHALDYDPEALVIARSEVRKRGITNVEYGCADVQWPLWFAGESFDAVFCLDVIEHIVPRQAVLHEIARVLTPDGVLLISAPNRATTWRRWLVEAGLFSFSDPDHKVEYTREEFCNELAEAGFEPGALMPIVYDTPWAGLIDALGGLSLTLYARLSRWKRDMAMRYPEESTGFRAVARKHK